MRHVHMTACASATQNLWRKARTTGEWKGESERRWRRGDSSNGTVQPSVLGNTNGLLGP